MPQQDIRTTMVHNLSPEQAHLGSLLKNPETTLKQLETPYLKKHSFYRGKLFASSKPVIFFLAMGPDQVIHELTGDPDAFFSVISKANLQLRSRGQAEAYVRNFFEICRDQSRLAYIVESPEDVRFRPNLTPELETEKSTFLSTHGTKLRPMEVHAAQEGFHVSFFIISEQELQQIQADLLPTGQLNFSTELVAGNLPTVYGL